MTTKLFPAMVSVAVLDCVVGLDAAVIPTLPEPVCVPPLVMVTHDAPLVAVHVHAVVVVTPTVLLPPAAENAWLAGASANEHDIPA